MSEEWRAIDIAPNYAVSSLGRVKRIAAGPGTAAGRLKQPSDNGQGYLVVMLLHAGKRRLCRVHRLVCTAFHGPQPSPEHEVAHRNGRRDDNRKENLRWALPVDNMADNYANGTIFYGTDHWNGRFGDDVIRDIRASDERGVDLSKRLGVSQSHISSIRHGRERATVQ